MPKAATSCIPLLVEQIFEKYGSIFKKQKEEGSFSKVSHKQFFSELYAIFGDVFVLALRLLDEQSITIYVTESGNSRAIAEITEGRQAKRVVKLFPDINYCQCDEFSTKVLGIEKSSGYQTTQLGRSDSNKSYTCRHVLALRLAKLLDSDCLRQEVLPKHKLNFLLMQMLQEDISGGGGTNNDALNITCRPKN